MTTTDRYVPWERDPTISICRDCGTVVTDTEAHDRLHRQLDRADRAAASLGPIG